MPDPPRIRSAVTGTPFPAAPLCSAELRVEEVLGGAIAHLEAARPGPALDRFHAALDISSLPQPGRIVAGHEGVLVPIGPAIWLGIGVPPATGAFAIDIDVSGAWTHLVIAGSAATRLLGKGCALDLHPSQFPPRACAAAGFTRLRTIIWRAQQDQFQLLVGRSYARTLWEWLTETAAEFNGSLPPRQ